MGNSAQILELEEKIRQVKVRKLEEKIRARKSAMVDSIFAEDLKVRDAPDVTQDMSTGGKVLAGVGQGLTNIGRRATNLMLPKSMEPDWAFDEAIANQERSDEDLLNTGAGQVGSLVGETAALLPTGAIGGGLNKARTAYKGLRAGKNVAQVGKPGRVFQATKAGAEGAGIGAVIADPEDREGGAGFGGAISTGLNIAGQAGGRLGRGLVKTSQKAKDLVRTMQSKGVTTELPLGMKAEEGGISGIAKWVYNNFLPYMPGTSTNLKKQTERVIRDFGATAVEFGRPKTFKKSLGKADDAMQDLVTNVQDHFNKGWDRTLGQYSFHSNRLGRLSNEASDVILPYVKEGRLSGGDLARAKQELLKKAAKHVDDPVKDVFNAIRSAVDELDELVMRRLTAGQGKQNLKNLKEYQDLSAKWLEFKQVEEVSRAADLGRIMPNPLTKTLQKASAKSGEVTPLQKYAELGEEVIGKTIPEPSVWGRVAAATSASGIAFAAGGAPLAAATLGAAPLMATKPVQKALMGDTKKQQQLMKMLKKYPWLSEALRLGTTGATQ